MYVSTTAPDVVITAETDDLPKSLLDIGNGFAVSPAMDPPVMKRPRRPSTSKRSASSSLDGGLLVPSRKVIAKGHRTARVVRTPASKSSKRSSLSSGSVQLLEEVMLRAITLQKGRPLGPVGRGRSTERPATGGWW